VKTNLVHILYQVKATGVQPLENFKDLFTDEKYRKCKSSTLRKKTWLNLTSDVFVAFFSG
jgi:hypothetical protein